MNNESSLKDSIYNSVLEDILSHKYRPNQILNEKTLAEKYECSKTPVREALLSLCNDNVLRNIPRYGYEVVRLTIEDMRVMLQFRYILESGFLMDHYDKFSDSQIDQLTAINEKCNAADNDVWGLWAYNSDFHLKMISFCNNSYALEELQKCMSRLKRAYAQFYWDKWDAESLPLDTRNHSQIIQCIKDKNLEGLLSHLKNDLNDFSSF